MAERTTIKASTTGGHNYDLVEYVTGGEARLLGFMAGKDGLTIQDQEALHDKMITLAVKSLDGTGENVLERVKDLPAKDYIEIIQECTRVFAGLDEQKKTL